MIETNVNDFTDLNLLIENLESFLDPNNTYNLLRFGIRRQNKRRNEVNENIGDAMNPQNQIENQQNQPENENNINDDMNAPNPIDPDVAKQIPTLDITKNEINKFFDSIDKLEKEINEKETHLIEYNKKTQENQEKYQNTFSELNSKYNKLKEKISKYQKEFDDKLFKKKREFERRVTFKDEMMKFTHEGNTIIFLDNAGKNVGFEQTYEGKTYNLHDFLGRLVPFMPEFLKTNNAIYALFNDIIDACKNVEYPFFDELADLIATLYNTLKALEQLFKDAESKEDKQMYKALYDRFQQLLNVCTTFRNNYIKFTTFYINSTTKKIVEAFELYQQSEKNFSDMNGNLD